MFQAENVPVYDILGCYGGEDRRCSHRRFDAVQSSGGPRLQYFSRRKYSLGGGGFRQA
jgi:hypothetical protein